jgi:hypothetical protein
MRSCTICHSSSPDTAQACVSCGADLATHSETAVVLARLRANPRVGKVRIMPHGDCCPACREAEGEWPKEQVPDLPVQGCSHPMGCRCFYEPELVDIFP